jgi:hypothetical protein
MVFRGRVDPVTVDDAGCGWGDVTHAVAVGDRTCTECAARIALPTHPTDNPWQRQGPDWRP